MVRQVLSKQLSISIATLSTIIGLALALGGTAVKAAMWVRASDLEHIGDEFQAAEKARAEMQQDFRECAIQLRQDLQRTEDRILARLDTIESRMHP